MPSFYGSVETADAYHTARGNYDWFLQPYWDGTVPQKEGVLQRGSDYIDTRYGRYFPGSKTGGRAQERAWPRTGAEDRDGETIGASTVPAEIEHAAYEAALRELVSPGSLSPDINIAEVITSETIGPLKTDYGRVTKAEDARVTATLIDQILFPILLPIRGAVLAV